MEREILFRGKRVDGKGWVYGHYYKGVVYPSSHKTHNIYNNGEIIVIPESVGQYTGITDKEGNKIFEGDIVKLMDNWGGSFPSVDSYCLYEVDLILPYGIRFIVVQVSDFHKKIYHIDKGHSFDLGDWTYKHLEIFGNIFDNPELIKDATKNR